MGACRYLGSCNISKSLGRGQSLDYLPFQATEIGSQGPSAEGPRGTLGYSESFSGLRISYLVVIACRVEGLFSF